jgi:hypothetical protein
MSSTTFLEELALDLNEWLYRHLWLLSPSSASPTFPPLFLLAAVFAWLRDATRRRAKEVARVERDAPRERCTREHRSFLGVFRGGYPTSDAGSRCRLVPRRLAGPELARSCRGVASGRGIPADVFVDVR